jgi:hypothetical protein
VKEDSAKFKGLIPNQALENPPTQELAMLEDLRVINSILNGK